MKTTLSAQRRESGYNLIEVIIATAMLGIVAITIFGVGLTAAVGFAAKQNTAPRRPRCRGRR